MQVFSIEVLREAAFEFLKLFIDSFIYLILICVLVINGMGLRNSHLLPRHSGYLFAIELLFDQPNEVAIIIISIEFEPKESGKSELLLDFVEVAPSNDFNVIQELQLLPITSVDLPFTRFPLIFIWSFYTSDIIPVDV